MSQPDRDDGRPRADSDPDDLPTLLEHAVDDVYVIAPTVSRQLAADDGDVAPEDVEDLRTALDDVEQVLEEIDVDGSAPT